MLRYHEPETLADIASDTFIDYIRTQLCRFLDRHYDEEMLSSDITLFKNKCKNLNRFVNDTLLPSTLAYSFTRKLFGMINHKIFEAGAIPGKHWYKEVMSNLIAALLPHTLTKLEFGPKNLHHLMNFS